MDKGPALTAIAISAAICIGGGTEALAADKFQRLFGSQIRAKFMGRALTGEVHWYDLFDRDGMLKTHAMGRKRDGKWWVEKDKLCEDLGKEFRGCYQVWISGNKVQLRSEGRDSVEGVLDIPKGAQ
jgi:hypothetical protein